MSLRIPIVDGNGQAPRMMVLSGLPGTRSEVRAMKRGPAGNEQTLEQMKEFVLRDYNDVAIQDFANGLVTGISSHNPALVANALFLFVRSFKDREGHSWGITYRSDPYGFEQIQDARTTIQKGVGDCGDKTTLLATLLGAVGIKSRPIVLSYQLPAFQHVYLEAFYGDGWHVFDPTPEESLPGQQSRGLKRATFRFFPDDLETPATLSGTTPPSTTTRLIAGGVNVAGSSIGGGLKGGIVAGATLAVSFIPVVGPFLAPVVGMIAGLFHHGPTAEQKKLGSDFDVADKACAAYLLTLNAKADAGTLTGSDMAEAASQVAQVAQLAIEGMQRDASGYVTKQWKGKPGDEGEESRYGKWLTALQAKVVPGSEGTSSGAGLGLLDSITGGGGSGTTSTLLWVGGGAVALYLIINLVSGKSGR